MNQLPPEMLPVVSYIKFGIFDLAIPNLIAWLAVIVFLIYWGLGTITQVL